MPPRIDSHSCAALILPCVPTGAVAHHQGFTRAAAALHVSQPALSQQVRQLEESLGAQLFDRTGRKTRLTDAGEVYLRYALRAAQELREGQRAIHDVGDLSRGTLRIAVTPTFTTYLVGPLVEAFHCRYPNIVLNVHELAQEHMEHQLLADELDVGIGFDEVHAPDIEAFALLVETLALVVGSQHPLAGERNTGLHEAFVTAALLGQHPLPADAAHVVADTLGLDADAVLVLQSVPLRGSIGNGIPTDPTIYRFYEMIQVYGTTLKALVHEKFGDGIISAINFKLDVKKVDDPDGGSRAVITLDGKYLPTKPF